MLKIQETYKNFEQYIGYFCVVEFESEKKNKTMKAIGVLKQITDEGSIHIISNTGWAWIINPSKINSFFARPDKMSNKRGEAHA